MPRVLFQRHKTPTELDGFGFSGFPVAQWIVEYKASGATRAERFYKLVAPPTDYWFGVV